MALLGYSEDNGILEIETNYNINFDSEVFDVSKTIIATSLYNLVNEPPPLMSGRPGLSADRAWSGFENGGNLDDNCVDWVTTNGFASVAEDFNGLDRDWSMTGLGCTTHERRHLCLCW